MLVRCPGIGSKTCARISVNCLPHLRPHEQTTRCRIVRGRRFNKVAEQSWAIVGHSGSHATSRPGSHRVLCITPPLQPHHGTGRHSVLQRAGRGGGPVSWCVPACSLPPPFRPIATIDHWTWPPWRVNRLCATRASRHARWFGIALRGSYVWIIEGGGSAPSRFLARHS
jgi:hypothetical protein